MQYSRFPIQAETSQGGKMKAKVFAARSAFLSGILTLLIIAPSGTEARNVSVGHGGISTVTPAAQLRYNQAALLAIDKEAGQSVDKRYSAVLRGLRWCVVFSDNDSNFNFTFTNYITMLHELTLHSSHSGLKRIVHALIVKEFKRAIPRLDTLFAADEDGYMDFVTMLPIAYRHKVPLKPLKIFAAGRFEKITPPDRLNEFRLAAKNLDYDLLTNLIIEAAFMDMAYEMGGAKDFQLPPNNYRTIMDECAGIPFLHKYNDDAYHDQNYYATHVLLALNHYGQETLKASATGDRVFQYLAGQYSTVRNQAGDFDLLCEYLYCLRQFVISGVSFITEGERHIMSLQNPDGSWGTVDDFNGDPYDQFHPTWTAITLLVLDTHK